MTAVSGTLFLLLIGTQSVNAQPGDPNGGGKPGEEVPITGIEILLAAGGALGLRSLLARRNKSKE